MKKATSRGPGVRHHLPHRTRLRVPKQHRQDKTFSELESRLKKVRGVKDVEINPKTGSVLIHHHAKENVLDELGLAVQEIAAELFEAIFEIEEAEVPGLSILSKMVKSHLSKMDTSVASATGNVIDLKTVVPVSLALAAVFKGIRDKAWIGEVPAFVLFYYAYDSYMKFHGPSVQPVSNVERAETPDGRLFNPVQSKLQGKHNQGLE